MKFNVEELLCTYAFKVYVFFSNDCSFEETKNLDVYEFDSKIQMQDVSYVKELLTTSRSSKKKIVIKSTGITHSAQNSLLKILEEIDANVCLFFVFPVGSILLDTFLSRCAVIHENQETHNLETDDSFFALSPKAKLNYIEDMLESNNNKQIAMYDFLNMCEVYAHRNILGNKKMAQFLEIIFKLKKIIKTGFIDKNMLNMLALTEVC